MANPKKKHTSMRKNMRRSMNWKISGPNLVKCSNCGGSMITHQVCPDCGFYNGALVLPRKVKKNKEGQAEG